MKRLLLIPLIALTLVAYGAPHATQAFGGTIGTDGPASGGNPSSAPSGGNPAATPSGGSPAGTPSGGNPAGTPSGGNPAATPSGGNPADSSSGVTLVNPLKVDSLKGLLDLVLSAAIQLGSIVLVLAIIWVGFLFVAARGNEEKIRSARTALMWTIIGGLILLGAKGIESVISATVNTL